MNSNIKRNLFKEFFINIKLFPVEKDVDYTISKQFLDKNAELRHFILERVDNS